MKGDYLDARYQFDLAPLQRILVKRWQTLNEMLTTEHVKSA